MAAPRWDLQGWRRCERESRCNFLLVISRPSWWDQNPRCRNWSITVWLLWICWFFLRFASSSSLLKLSLWNQASFYHPLTFNQQGYMTSADVEVTQLSVAWWIKHWHLFRHSGSCSLLDKSYDARAIDRVCVIFSDIASNFVNESAWQFTRGYPVLRGSQLHKCTKAVASLEKRTCWEGRSMNFLQWQCVFREP